MYTGPRPTMNEDTSSIPSPCLVYLGSPPTSRSSRPPQADPCALRPPLRPVHLVFSPPASSTPSPAVVPARRHPP
jgi:hypothetical protein